MCLLQHRIRTAERRIFLSSLYLGKEEHEVISTLHEALSRNSQLTLHYIADYLRSTREAPHAPCSASLLAPLKASFPDRVHISFWHTPELNGLSKAVVPNRFNEGWGLWHAKIYGADDEVVLSGANLSRDYFTNRQDRYISIKHPRFADYAHTAVLVGQSMSYDLQAMSVGDTNDNPTYTLNWPPSVTASPASSAALPEPSSRDSLVYKARAREMWREMQVQWTEDEAKSTISKEDTHDDDVEIRPFLQIGSLSIREETDLVVPYLLQLGSGDGVQRLDLTSGYFSLDSLNQLRVLNSPAEKINVICASPQVSFSSSVLALSAC